MFAGLGKLTVKTCLLYVVTLLVIYVAGTSHDLPIFKSLLPVITKNQLIPYIDYQPTLHVYVLVSMHTKNMVKLIRTLNVMCS